MENSKTLIEVIKANKSAILKKALIVVGAAVGTAVLANMLKGGQDEDEVLEFAEEDVTEVEEVTVYPDDE